MCITTTATDDFTPQNPLTITFPPQSAPSHKRCVQYQIIGDDFKEVDETFTINVVAENRFDFIQGPSNLLVTLKITRIVSHTVKNKLQYIIFTSKPKRTYGDCRKSTGNKPNYWYA